jgi:hypothetical protein
MYCPQEKEEAMQALAAAAGAGAGATLSSSTGGGCRPLLSDEEKQALRDSGKQARAAESQQLAARVECSDAALRCMTEQEREQWFQVGGLQHPVQYTKTWLGCPHQDVLHEVDARGWCLPRSFAAAPNAA